MAKAKESSALERTYNVPLRKEFQKVPRWRKTKKAVTALRQFLAKHMKSDNVKISKEINQELWKHGIRNPPHHIKVNVSKDSEGVVRAELFAVEKKTSAKKEEKKVKKPKTEEKKPEEKPEVKEKKE